MLTRFSRLYWCKANVLGAVTGNIVYESVTTAEHRFNRPPWPHLNVLFVLRAEIGAAASPAASEVAH